MTSYTNNYSSEALEKERAGFKQFKLSPFQSDLSQNEPRTDNVAHSRFIQIIFYAEPRTEQIELLHKKLVLVWSHVFEAKIRQMQNF